MGDQAAGQVQKHGGDAGAGLMDVEELFTIWTTPLMNKSTLLDLARWKAQMREIIYPQLVLKNNQEWVSASKWTINNAKGYLLSKNVPHRRLYAK